MFHRSQSLIMSMALPSIALATILAVTMLVAFSGEPGEDRHGGAVTMVSEVTEEAREDEEDLGYGYVEAIPDDAPPTLDPDEKAVAMEGAYLTARLGGGWEEGGMLAEDLRMLTSTATSQLELYEEELERMERAGEISQARAEQWRGRHEEAVEALEELESAGRSLREAMVGLREAVEQGEAEAGR